MKRLFSILILSLFLISLTSAFEFDNSIKYSENDMKVNIKNAFGLGVDYGNLELKSHSSVNEIRKVGAGKQVVMYYDFSFNDIYNNGLGNIYFKDMKTGKNIQKDYSFVYWGETQRDVYSNVCSDGKINANGTISQDCNRVKSGTESYEIWLPYNSRDIPKGNIRIGLQTDVKVDDYVDGVWEIAGQKIDRHASWEASLDVGLITYYSLNENSGNAVDNVAGVNATNVNSVNQSVDGIVKTLGAGFDGVGYFNEITGKAGNLTGNTWSMSLWMNSFSVSSNKIILDRQGSSGAGYYLDYRGGENQTRLQYNGANNLFSQPQSVLPNVWNMITIVGTATNITMFVNGNYSSNSSSGSITEATLPLVIGVSNAGDVGDRFNGTMDEIAFWNRSLTIDEVENLYNEGVGCTYGNCKGTSTSISVNLNSPEDDYTTTSNQIITFNSSATISNGNFTNTTLMIWDSDGDLYKTNFTVITGQSNLTNFTVSNWTFGTFNWNYYWCGINQSSFSNCSFASTNRTFNIIAFNVLNQTYETDVLETSNQLFQINVETVSGVGISQTKLVYNGTEYTVNNISNVGNVYTFTKNIDIPLNPNAFANTTNNFHWQLTLTGLTSIVQTTNSTQQNVSFINFQGMNTTYNTAVLNFTLKDELTNIEINATTNPVTFQSTFYYWLGNGDIQKNYSLNVLNSTGNNKFNFSIFPTNENFSVTASIDYDSQGYSQREYFMHEAQVNLETNPITLLLLDDSNAVKFFIKTLQGTSFVSNVIITINKFFVGEGIYKTVGLRQTDDLGEFVEYLEIDNNYRFIIIQNGTLLGTVKRTSTCQTAPCLMELNLIDASPDLQQGFLDFYGGNVAYTLFYNTTTETVESSFTDVTGLAQYFRLLVYRISTNNESGTEICNTQVFATSGSANCNLTNYQGEFRADLKVSRSPEKTIDFIHIIKTAFFKIIGTFGLFLALFLTSILSLVGAIIGGAVMGIMMIPLSLTALKIMNILPFSWGIIAIIFLVSTWIASKVRI